MRQTSVARLFEDNRERLRLAWVGGPRDALIRIPHEDVSPADLVGHLNLIHPERIQVIGAAEMGWAHRQPFDKVKRHLGEIVGCIPPAVIVADGCEVPDFVRSACSGGNIPLMASQNSAAAVIDLLRIYLSRELAEKVTLHGVLMDVLGMGVLVTGESGVGKSELALELISRGHGLVADDIVEIYRVAPHSLEGRCPEMLKDFLEVRGLGVLNIRTVFGETACRRKMRVKLVVHLQKPIPGIPEATRLPLDAEQQDILGVRLRRVTIPVAAGRNLAVLLEAAVRSTVLLLRGIDSTQEFIERQKRALDDPAQ
jgi:HPr kinase/phosphorylase